MVTPQELGITEIRTPSALPDFFKKQGGSAFHRNALRTVVRRAFRFPKCSSYNGTKGIPVPEMPFVQNALPSHFTL